jgi:hypothetical protein
MTPTTASTLQRDVGAVVSAADAFHWDAAIDAHRPLTSRVKIPEPSLHVATAHSKTQLSSWSARPSS